MRSSHFNFNAAPAEACRRDLRPRSRGPGRDLIRGRIGLSVLAMIVHAIRCCRGCLLAGLLLWPLPPGLAAAGPAPAPAAAMTDYHRKLEVYTAARRKYESEADAYWDLIAQMRHLRNAKR